MWWTNFLEKYNLPNLTQDETEFLNSPKSSLKLEVVIKNISRKKTSGSDGSTGIFY